MKMNSSERISLASLARIARPAPENKKLNSSVAVARMARAARATLEKVSEDIRWPLFDLLDWYKSDQDMTDIAGLPFDKVKALVNEYLAHIDTLRGKDHHLTRMRLDPYYTIACRQCQHWTADKIGAYGIGDCSIHSVPVPPAYPDAKRRCFEYKVRL